MTTAPLLMPDLALQFPLGMRTDNLLALAPQSLCLLEHPRVSGSMLRRTDSTIPDVFRKVLRVCEDLRLRDLGEGSDGVEP